jgi:predicted nucleotidyltransferase
MDTRIKIAKEAARLIYRGIAEEYKQAKNMAARNIGINSMPSNYEVAIELDLLADQEEGDGRRKLIVKLRYEALKLMKVLDKFDQILTGSVWRGTARKGSDIDINVYSNKPKQVEKVLQSSGYKINESKEVVATSSGKTNRTWHIYTNLEDGIVAEVIVRPLPEKEKVEKCEIYGDSKRGLSKSELEKIMRNDPLRKFVPKRRYG